MRRVFDHLRRSFGSSPVDAHAFTLWSDRARERQDAARPILVWSDSPVVLRHYIHPSISGRSDGNWLIWAAGRYFHTPVDVALTIGSGDGGLERHGLLLRLARRFEAFDASAGAVELARGLAKEEKVDDCAAYVVADLNDHVFEPGRYGAAFASMSVHHIRELEHLFTQVSSALQPDALFVANEYVGPNQFQWTDKQMQLATDLLRQLPERYRRSLMSGQLKDRIIRQTVAHMNAVDPTEAIRSSEIVRLMGTYFEIVERVDFGGTLLNLVLEEIAGNFNDTEEDLAVLQPLFDAERDYLARRVIDSDFAVLVARNRSRQ